VTSGGVLTVLGQAFVLDHCALDLEANGLCGNV
jgi:hypothetical protein